MATLFHQPDSGEVTWSREHLLEALAEAGIEAAYCSATEEGWRDCLASARGLVIAAGGDGTVARVATSLPDSAEAFAMVPLGSGNNIARSLGYPADNVAGAIAGLATARDVPLRIAEVSGRWGIRRFVESVGLGALARSVAELQDASLDGDVKRAAGRAALARVVEEIRPVRASVCADGEPLDEPSLLVECMNIGMVGPNLRLGEEARAGDEHLSLVWLPETARDDMVRWLRAPDERPAPVRHRPACRIEIDAHDEPLRIDDKTVEWDGSRISLRLRDRVITVRIPGGAR